MTFNKLSVLILTLIILLNLDTVFAKRFAVVNLVAKNINDGQTALVSNSLRTRLLSASKGDAVPPAMQKQILSQKGVEDKASDDENYLKSVGEALGVEQVIGGTISSNNDIFNINLKVYGINEGRVIGTIEASTANGFGDVMQTVLPVIAKKVVNGDLTPAENNTEVATSNEAPQDDATQEQPKQEAPANITLNIISNPMGAILSVNGEEKGPTPIQVEIPKGMYQLSLSADGYETLNQQMLVDGSQTDFAFELKEVKKEEEVQAPAEEKELTSSETEEGLPATVVIGTQPEGATVLMDNQNIGVSNLLYQTTSGQHTFSFSLEGYRDTSLTLNIKGNENNIIELPLTPSASSAEFVEATEGNQTMKIVKISLGILSVALLGGGFAINNSIDGLAADYKNETNPDKVNTLHNDIDSKSKLRNICYIGSGVAATGFAVTFIIH